MVDIILGEEVAILEIVLMVQVLALIEPALFVELLYGFILQIIFFVVYRGQFS